MKIINCLVLCSLISSQVFAEKTPEGGTPTYTNEHGGFTYYYIDGTPVPPGTKIFLGLDARGGSVMDENNRNTGIGVYDTRENAARAKKAADEYDPCNQVFVAGPSEPAPCTTNTTKPAKVPSDEGEVLSEEDYDKAVYELAAILYGATEIAEKSCTPAGEKIPKSLTAWWKAVKVYTAGESARDKKLNDKINELQKRIQALTSGSADAKDMQLESIRIQIETVSASIESIVGRYGRIPLREKLILAGLESLEFNAKENEKTVKAFKDLVNIDVLASVDVAKQACERTRKVQSCKLSDDGTEQCKELTEKDPVPGCEVAMAKIPALRAGLIQSYGESYLVRTPSTALNDKMQKFEVDIDKEMESIPKSNDANFDWSTPIENGFKKMKLARKDSGAKCPSADDDEEKKKISKAAKNFLLTIGIMIPSDDVIEYFHNIWKTTDKVIGQGAYRHEYFDYIINTTNNLLATDRVQLDKLLASKAKLELYLIELKKLYDESKDGKGPKNNVASNGSNQTKVDVAPRRIVLGASGRSSESVFDQHLDNIGRKNSPAGSVRTNGLTALAAAAVGNSSSGVGSSGSAGFFGFSSGSVNATDGLSLSGNSMAIARRALSNIRDSQKNIETSLAAIRGNDGKNSGSSQNGNSSGNGSIKGAKTSLAAVGASSTLSSFKDSMLKSSDELSKSSDADELYKAASYGSLKNEFRDQGAYYGGASSSRTYEKSSSYSTPSSSKRKNGSDDVSDSDSKYKRMSKSSSEDSKIISQSILARKNGSESYSAEENDSLFERVTKAYIRNYEKVEDVSSTEEQ